MSHWPAELQQTIEFWVLPRIQGRYYVVLPTGREYDTTGTPDRTETVFLAILGTFFIQRGARIADW
jgi:hypothetical protein